MIAHMASTSALSDAAVALVRHGAGGVRIFPSTLEDMQGAPPEDPFVLGMRRRTVSAVVEAGVSLMDVATKCALFWGDDASSGFVGDLAKCIVLRSAPLGRVKPLPPEPGPYTLVEWYAEARVLLPMDYTDDRTVVSLPTKALLSRMVSDIPGLPSFLTQKSTPRPGLISPDLTARDLFSVASRNAADGNDLAKRVLAGTTDDVAAVLDFFEMADNAALVFLAMRPDGYALLKQLEKVLARGPTGDPPLTDELGTSPQARARDARTFDSLAEKMADENQQEMWDKQYKTR
jgi:hypothetical protein